jgi:DNA-binding MarR family transcriptional regulator
MSNCTELVRTLPHVPPSVQTVLCTLYGHDPMTGAALREATGLPRRTIYAALRTLRGMGLLRERISLRDTRQTYFWLDSHVQPTQVAPPGNSHAAA